MTVFLFFFFVYVDMKICCMLAKDGHMNQLKPDRCGGHIHKWPQTVQAFKITHTRPLMQRWCPGQLSGSEPFPVERLQVPAHKPDDSLG